MELTVIIVNWNTKDLLLECLASIYGTIREIRFEVWLVDNASSDGSVAAAVEKFPDIHVIQNRRNLGFAAANNIALRRMEGRYALLINTDATLTERAAEILYRFMENTPDAGIACGQLLNPDGSLQRSVASFPSLALLLGNETLLGFLFPKKYPNKRRRYIAPIPVDSCIGACMMVRASALPGVGLMDESFFFFFEETDWALRMRRNGWKVFFVPEATIFHAQGQSVGIHARGRILFYRSRYIYLKKWFPRCYTLFFAAVFLRLLINTLLTGAGALLTLGLSAGLRRRLGVYLKLIAWHLKGCP
jgi:hypothetical protein